MNTQLLGMSECARFGEYEVIDTPDWFVVIGTAVVVIGLAWCVWKAVMP